MTISDQPAASLGGVTVMASELCPRNTMIVHPDLLDEIKGWLAQDQKTRSERLLDELQTTLQTANRPPS